MKINIYQVNDCDWMAAESLESAATAYREWTGEEIDHDEAYELDDEELDRLELNAKEGFYGLSDGKHSFRVALAGALADGWIAPFLFASTEQ